MDFRFLGNPWNASSYSQPLYQQTFRGIPVGPFQVQPKPTPPPAQPMKPKVVSIPVHFAGSERGRSDSAVKIQKVFRGFLVRINTKKIKAIWEEVKDIESRILKKETVHLISNDSRERLKVNEMLMSLLLKLDSVRGVDSGVRDFRKFVIKKVIALQELVDAIVSGDQTLDSTDADAVTETKTEGIDENQRNIDSASAKDCNRTPELQNHDEITTKNDEFTPNLSESDVTPQNHKTIEASEEIMVAHQGDETSIETSSTESQTDSSANPKNLVEDNEEEAAPAPEENVKEKEDSGEWESKRGKELLEKMMVDNDKMMGLMAELCERNEKQSRLLSALTQRVEQLEKAFLCDKLRRKKRRSTATAGCVDRGEKSPDVKKCGKR